MSGGTLTGENWSLREAAAADIEALMHWFPTSEDVMIWGGPSFR